MIHKNPIPQYNYILGSASPRRKQLLEGLNINFKIMIPNVDEDYPQTIPNEDVPIYLANKKADYFGKLADNELLICADTIVIINNIILNKPLDIDEAYKMLNTLSGNVHEVVTGVSLKTNTKQHSFSVLSKVYFKDLKQSEIDFYIEHFKPYDKAGGYGVQEWIGYIAIDKIEGSYYNVMGLPVKELYENLIQF